VKRIQHILFRVPEKTLNIFLTGLFGLAAGLSSVAFLLTTNGIFKYTYLAWMTQPLVVFLGMSFVVIMGSSLLVGVLVSRLSREAAGSGVPQLKAAYWKELGFVPWRSVWVRFLAGAASLGGGASLGREGPTVYIGGGLASCLAGWLGTPKGHRRDATLIGAAAGLAAAFNTPLAAVTFVLEEMLGDFGSRAMGKVVLGAVIGAFTVHALVGKQPAFSLPMIESNTWTLYIVVPLVAAVAALLGVIFQRASLHWREHVRRRHRVPKWLKPCIGGLITWVLGCGIYALNGHVGVFSLGYQDLSAALNNQLTWQVAGALVLAKLLATIACYSTGGSGGIFSPTLFLGGLSGVFLARVAGHWLPLGTDDHIILAVVGMSACFGAVVRAPLTAVLMVFEMTHQFALVPALLLGTIISQSLARLAGGHNFYDALLLQDGHELIHIKPPRDMTAWQHLPVSAVANFKPVVLRDFAPDQLAILLDHHPYRCFPVMKDDRLQSVVTRAALEEMLHKQVPPPLEVPVTCLPDQTIREVADRFLDTPSGFMVVVDPGTASVRGVLTLHDLLRAQAALAE
jgi:CIC family chloride channel protein